MSLNLLLYHDTYFSRAEEDSGLLLQHRKSINSCIGVTQHWPDYCFLTWKQWASDMASFDIISSSVWVPSSNNRGGGKENPEQRELTSERCQMILGTG